MPTVDPAARPGSSLLRTIALGESIAGALRRTPGINAATLAGAARRRAAGDGDNLVLVVAADEVAPVWLLLATWPGVDAITADGPARIVVSLRCGLVADVRVVAREAFGAALIDATGSEAHVTALRARAARAGLRLDATGLWNERGERVAGASEELIYTELGLGFVPPELREDTGELEAAAAGRLPRLVEEADLWGDLHVGGTVAGKPIDPDDLFAAAARRGRQYLAVIERVRGAVIELAALSGHVTAIRAASSRRLRLMAGVELEVGGDDGADLSPEALEVVDWVVAAVPDDRSVAPDAATRGLLRAIEAGVVDAVRIPPGADAAAILAACRERGVALELDAGAIDLDDAVRVARAAGEAGIMVALGSGAAGSGQLERLRLAVWVARRAGLTADDLLSTLTWEELGRWREHRVHPGARRRRAA